MSTALAFVANHKEQQWAPGTLKLKSAALKSFHSFLNGVGFGDEMMQPVDMSKEKSRALRLREEECLSAYALMRMLAGQSRSGILGQISNIRTAYLHIWRLPFGIKGEGSQSSFTSEFVKSMTGIFPDA